MTSVAASPPARHSVLPLWTLLSANGISLIGTQLTQLAVPWFVLQTTGSPTRTGVVAVAGVVPLILSAFFGGAVVDRLGFRRTSIWSDLASCLTTALIPLLYLTVGSHSRNCCCWSSPASFSMPPSAALAAVCCQTWPSWPTRRWSEPTPRR